MALCLNTLPAAIGLNQWQTVFTEVAWPLAGCVCVHARVGNTLYEGAIINSKLGIT